MRKLILMLVLLFTCYMAGAQESSSQSTLPFDGNVVKGVLPNGLTYYIRHNDNPKERAFFYIVQKVGSVQEEDEQRGLAHFLEHMCFNGSEHFKGNGITDFCQRIGVRYGRDLNAYTSTDETVYNIDNVPTTVESNLDSCLLILYDWSHALTLDPKEIDKERGVIHEEWRMRSSAIMRIFERQLPTLMKGSRYANRLPIGLMSVIDNFKPDVLRAYYEKWYRPDLQAIVIVGDIDAKQMESKVKELFSRIPAVKDGAALEYYPIPGNKEPIVVVDKDKEIATPSIDLMIKHRPLPRKARQTTAALVEDYVTTVMQQMMQYRFDDLTQNPEAPYNSLDVGDTNFLLGKTEKALAFSTTPKDGKSEAAAEEMMREIVRADRYGFTEPEYERAKKQFLSNLDQKREAYKNVKSNQLVQECVDNFLNDEALPPFELAYSLYGKIADAVSLETVNRYFKGITAGLDSNIVIMGIYPEREGVAVPEAGSLLDRFNKVKAEEVKPYEVQTVDAQLLEQEPKAGTVKKELKADALGYKTLLLSNGIKVLYKQTDFDASKIVMSAVANGGENLLDSQELEQAQMFNSVMGNNGLGKFNSNDLSKVLTGRQVSIMPELDENYRTLTGNTSPKDLRTLMQLVYLYFTELNYDTLNFRNTMKQTEQEIANKDVRPTSALNDSIIVRLYANNPRMQPMTLERLHRVDYDKLRSLYKKLYANPAEYTFVFTGNINEDSLRTFAQAYLAALPAGTGKKLKPVDAGCAYWKGNQECRFKRKMETPQAYLLQCRNGAFANNVENKAIADIAGQVLNEANLKNVREEHSLVYSVSTAIGCKSFPEEQFVMQVFCPVKPEKCDSALLLVDEELERVAAQGVASEPLEKARVQKIKVYENNQRENSYWHKCAINWILYGKDRHNGYREALENVSGKDVQKFLHDVVLKQGNRLNIIMLPE